MPSMIWLIASSLIPLVTLVVLYAFDVPLGRPETTGYVVYRYSPFVLWRLGAAGGGLLIAAVGLVGIALGFRTTWRTEAVRRWCVLSAIATYGLFVIWSFVAPPRFAEQHSFNMLSPSQDGAFVLESRDVDSICAYVSHDFYERLERDPGTMRGRRVLSNPPGVTVAYKLMDRFLQVFLGLNRRLSGAFGLDAVDDPVQRREMVSALLLTLGFTAAWGFSLFLAFDLFRLWFPPLSALALSMACVINPSTLDFTPGKDPAQMLTVFFILYGWMKAYRLGDWIWAGFVGACFMLSVTIGLVHIGVLAIIAGATMWHSLRAGDFKFNWFTRCLIPFIGGAVLITLSTYLALDWNIVRMTLTIGLGYRAIQPDIIATPFYWTLVGFPVFLLFVGPMFWMLLVAIRPKHGGCSISLGNIILICISVLLSYTYFFANNNEVTRLWMPFIPLWILGMALRRPLFFQDGIKTRWLCLLLIALHLIGTLGHWSLMDVRESEYRLSTGRMWD